MKTFTEAANTFLSVAVWLGDADAPAIAALQNTAAVLDKRITATMVGEYTKAYRMLRSPKTEATEDFEDEDMIPT